MSETIIAIPDDVACVRMAVVFTGIPAEASIAMTISAPDRAINLVVRMPVARWREVMDVIHAKYDVVWSLGNNLFEQVYTVYPR